LAKNGAKEAHQSVVVMLITLSEAEMFNVQSPGRYQQHPVKHFDGRAMKVFPIKKMKWLNLT
jgi:hypothetical protein